MGFWEKTPINRMEIPAGLRYSDPPSQHPSVVGFPWNHWVSALLSTTLAPFHGSFNSGNTLSLVPPQGLCTCCSLTFKWAHLQIFMPPFLSSTEISAQSHSSDITFLSKLSTAAHRPAHTITVLCCISPWHLTPFIILISWVSFVCLLFIFSFNERMGVAVDHNWMHRAGLLHEDLRPDDRGNHLNFFFPLKAT